MQGLSLDRLNLSFGGVTAVKDLSLEIEAGKIHAIIGPNGAGKTSVLNLISGYYAPDSGAILLDGKNLKRSFSALSFLKGSLIGLSVGICSLLFFNIQSIWSGLILEPQERSLLDILSAQAATDQIWFWIPSMLLIGIALLSYYLRFNAAALSPQVMSRAHIARTFQNIRLFNQLTVRENVLAGMLGAKQASRCYLLFRALFFNFTEEQLTRADRLLSLVGLERSAAKKAANLSYGDKRRLEIARALATNPQILLLDEPAAGLNSKEALELAALIKNLNQNFCQQKLTIILIEHHIKVVMAVADKITVLNFGEKLAEDTPQKIASDQRVIEAYLGKAAE